MRQARGGERAKVWARRCAVGGVAGALVALGVPGSRAAVPFTPGEGVAAGQAAAVVFQYGGAGLGFSVASTSGQYQDGTGSASAGMLESGFLTLVSGLQTCGRHGFDPSILPPTLSVTTNSNGNSAPVRKSTPGTAGFGPAAVAASPNADGNATAAALATSIPGLVTISGGSIHTEAATSPATQDRTSLAEIGEGEVSLLGGAVQLHGLHWRAHVKVKGADSRADRHVLSSAFDVGSVTVLGVTLPFPKGAQNPDALNRLLLPLGVQLRLPAITTASRAGVSSVTIGPLTVALGGKTPFGPLLHKLAGNLPAIEAALKPTVFDPTGCNELAGLLKLDPQLNSSWNLLATGYPIIAAALVGSVDGGGELDVNLGGVQASVDDTYFQTPSFGSPVFATSPASVTEQPGTPAVAATAALPGRPGPTRAATPAELAVQQQVRCETTSPAGGPTCWSGHAAAGAAAVAVLTVGLLAGDEVVRRRRRERRGLPHQQEVS
ncbi:MAG: hypothetical protein ACYDH6_15715 [Acidimicrobiales bacterium]